MTAPVEWPEEVVEAVAWEMLSPTATTRQASFSDVARQQARAALSCPAVQQHVAALVAAAEARGYERGVREAARAARNCRRPVGVGDRDTFVPGSSADAERAVLALIPENKHG